MQYILRTLLWYSVFEHQTTDALMFVQVFMIYFENNSEQHFSQIALTINHIRDSEQHPCFLNFSESDDIGAIEDLVFRRWNDSFLKKAVKCGRH